MRVVHYGFWIGRELNRGEAAAAAEAMRKMGYAPDGTRL